MTAVGTTSRGVEKSRSRGAGTTPRRHSDEGGIRVRRMLAPRHEDGFLAAARNDDTGCGRDAMLRLAVRFFSTSRLLDSSTPSHVRPPRFPEAVVAGREDVEILDDLRRHVAPGRVIEVEDVG